MSAYIENIGGPSSGQYGSYIENNNNIYNFADNFTAGSVLQSVQSNLGLTYSGGLVSSWADQSGNGRDYTQATGSQKPSVTAGLNGNPGVLFDGVDDRMFSNFMPPAPGTSNTWIGLVFRQITYNANARIIGDNLDSMVLYNNPSTPTITQYNSGFGGIQAFPLNNWECTETQFLNGADYLKRGSNPPNFGAAGNSAPGTTRAISGNGNANIEIVHLIYVTNPPQNQKDSWRAAVANKYGASVSV